MIGTVIVLLIVAALVGLAVFSMVKKHKSGGSCGCGCGCGCCAMAGACHEKSRDGETKQTGRP